MRFSFSLIGFTSVVAQIVLVRELMVVFSGNEMSLGLMLASWLLWTAAGSGLAGRCFPPEVNFARAVAGLQIATAAALPLTILAVRAGRRALQLIPGELPGPGAALITCLVCLGPFCLLSGSLFTAGARLCETQRREGAAPASGYVYWLEAGGSAVGGLVASLLLVPRLDPVPIAFLLSILNIAAATGWLVKRTSYRAAAFAALFAISAIYILPILAPNLETYSQAGLWPGMRLVTARHSMYGHLALLESEGSYSLYENGLILSHFPDPQGAEESVHYALAQAEAPHRILLIGGGMNGGVTEALKHTMLESIDYVEPDPAMLELLRDQLPRLWSALSDDARVHVRHEDGRLFLKRAADPYDVIIINLPDPQTAQLNRFYTLEFFREAAAKLTPRGILSFRLAAAENYISPDLASFLRCINKTLRMVFPQAFVMPGDVVHFFATGFSGTLVAQPQELLSRMKSRGLKTTYAGTSLLTFRMWPDRLRGLEEVIAPQPDTRINRDFTPVAYYYAIALWSGRFHSGYRDVLRIIAAVPFPALTGGVALALLIIAAGTRRISHRDRQLRLAIGMSVAAMGFTLIGLEVLLLLAFQAVYGFVYEQLALLIAALMTGMTAGAWFGMRRAQLLRSEASGAPDLGVLWRVQLAAVIWAPLQCLLFSISSSVTGAVARPAFIHGVFPAMAFLAGMLGGYQFLLASRAFFADSCGGKAGPGVLYAVDLAGSCAGALLLSVYLIPVYGFLQTSLLLSLMNVVPAALLMALGRARQSR